MTYISRKDSRGLDTTPSKTVEMKIINETGAVLTRYTPVRIHSDGTYQKINVSIEAEALACVGVINSETIAVSAGGYLAYNGTIEEVTTAADFGDTIYVDKTGGLTNVLPSIGLGGFVAGDFVIRIGVIAKNHFDPLKKDLILHIQVIGQL